MTTHTDLFWTTYCTKLKANIIRTPLEYGSPEDANAYAERVTIRMRAAAARRGIYGVAIHNSPPFKATCRSLEIKCTYKSIGMYLNS